MAEVSHIGLALCECGHPASGVGLVPSTPRSAPERLSKAYCPKHGDVTGQTFYGRGVGVVGQAPPPEREWCRCGWAVERVTYVREESP